MNFLEKSNDRLICIYVQCLVCLTPSLRTSHNTQTDLHGPCKARTLQHYSEIPLSSLTLVKLLEMWLYNITQISSWWATFLWARNNNNQFLRYIFVLIKNFWLDFFFKRPFLSRMFLEKSLIWGGKMLTFLLLIFNSFNSFWIASWWSCEGSDV